MNAEEMYHWFEEQVKQAIAETSDKLVLSYESTVTPGVFLGKIALAKTATRALVKTDIRPEGVRLHFPLSWQDELSSWLGVPPAEEYRLKSNWVNQPSIGVAAEHFDPHFKNLVAKVIELLQKEITAK
jgi:hypothetical protein